MPRQLSNCVGVGADDNLIDVPACLLPDDVHEVSVRALSSIESASQLLMEPMTPADWTILEAHADWLEHGGLLQQVSVTSAGQLLTLQCDRHVARVRVADESFGRRAGLWPDDEEDLMCLRLVADTKVIVQPKTNKLPSAVVKIDVGLGDYGQAMQELATRLDIPLVEADQCCAVVHPSTAAEALGPALDDDKLLAVIERTAIASADVRSWTIIRLSTSSFVAQGRIGTDDCERCRLCARHGFNEDYIHANSETSLKHQPPIDSERRSVFAQVQLSRTVSHTPLR